MLADEIESHKVEQFPICIRFVDKNYSIRYEFLVFGRRQQLTGKVIATEIVRVLEKSNLEKKKLPQTGYDSASNMLPEAVGLQKQIKELCEKAVYTHCCGHSLNLVITAVCKFPKNQNTLDKVKVLTMMF